MDLSLTSLCEGSNNVRELLMDISFPLSVSDSSCVGSASSGGSSFSSSGGGGGISVGSGSGISGIGSGGGVGVGGGSSSVGGSSGRGVGGGGGSKSGSINNSIEGGGSVVVVIADPPPDIDSDSDSDDKFFDALSNSHCVKCQIEYLGSHFHHCDLDSESGQSSNESELDDNSLDDVEQNTVNKIYSPLSTKRSQSITEHKYKSCTKNTNSYMRFYLIPIHKPS